MIFWASNQQPRNIPLSLVMTNNRTLNIHKKSAEPSDLNFIITKLKTISEMLHTHRGQENRVYDHAISSKQLHKSGTKGHTRTPLKIPLNDENIPLGLGGKSVRGSGRKHSGNENLMTVKGKSLQQPGRTPMVPQSRAPLGNKTTNAKTKAGQTGRNSAIKDRRQQHEIKPVPLQKPMRGSAEISQFKFTVKADESQSRDDEDPEYGPPPPEALPYISDILPRAGLTFEGLKQENIFQQSYATDDSGPIPSSEMQLSQELQDAADHLTQCFKTDSSEFDWGPIEKYDRAQRSLKVGNKSQQRVDQNVRQRHERVASTLSSRQAASYLTARASHKAADTASQSVASKPRLQAHSRAVSTVNIAGEAASRTTLGYNKGKVARSMLYGREPPAPFEATDDLKLVIPGDDSDLSSPQSGGNFEFVGLSWDEC